MINIELKDTASSMSSSSYEERFVAEYVQTKIRYQKLNKMLTKWEAGTLGFKPKCKKQLLLEQKRVMGQYLYILEVRAEVEGISLESWQ